MNIHEGSITLQSSADIDIVDITAMAQEFVDAGGIRSGQLCIHVPGSTASISSIEYEPGAIKDLRRALTQIAPMQADYAHHEAWHDGNGYSHVLAALMGPSRTFPVLDQTIVLGTWQQIIAIDLDNKPRRRKILLHLMGV